MQIDDLGDQLQSLEQRERSLREQIARLTARLGSEELTDEQRAVPRRDAPPPSGSSRQCARSRPASARGEPRHAVMALRTEEGAAVPAPQSRLDRTLDEALNVLAWEGSPPLRGIVAAPFALLAAAAIVGARFRRRREEERLLAAS